MCMIMQTLGDFMLEYLYAKIMSWPSRTYLATNKLKLFLGYNVKKRPNHLFDGSHKKRGVLNDVINANIACEKTK